MIMNKRIKYLFVIILFALVACNELKPNRHDVIKAIEGNKLTLPSDLPYGAGILLYVDGYTCSSCLEKELIPLWGLLTDSFPSCHPIVLVHSNDSKLPEINIFHKSDSTFKVIVSNSDSIRSKNQWIPEAGVYHGFILDSLGIVESYGYISNEHFIQKCYLYCKGLKD